jgi:D-sedoheptulose 7-phosphate isomerase
MNKKDIINNSFQSHIDLLSNMKEDFLEVIDHASQEIVNINYKKNKIFWCGNGGSASQANHLSAELVGGMYKKKIRPFQSICLNCDSAFITAWSNDDQFDNIFSRQLEALGRDGDILIALSTSGNSANIINAAKYAKSNDIYVISLTGNTGGEVRKYSDININISSNDTQRIQEIHILVGHILCDIVEQSL